METITDLCYYCFKMEGEVLIAITKIHFDSLLSLFKSRFSFRLFIFYFFGLSIPVLLLTGIALRLLDTWMRDDYILYKKSLNTQIAEQIDENITILDQQSASFLLFIDDLRQFIENPYVDYREQRRIYSYLMNLLEANRELDGIGILNLEGEMVLYRGLNQRSYNFASAKDEEWFIKTIKKGGASVFVGPHFNRFQNVE